MSHSPGPWRWVPFRNWDGGLQAADGTFVIRNDEYDEKPDNAADASLIASAPELLAMIRGLEWWPDPEGFMWCHSCRRLKAGAGHATDCRLAKLLGRFA